MGLKQVILEALSGDKTYSATHNQGRFYFSNASLQEWCAEQIAGGCPGGPLEVGATLTRQSLHDECLCRKVVADIPTVPYEAL